MVFFVFPMVSYDLSGHVAASAAGGFLILVGFALILMDLHIRSTFGMCYTFLLHLMLMGRLAGTISINFF